MWGWVAVVGDSGGVGGAAAPAPTVEVGEGSHTWNNRHQPLPALVPQDTPGIRGSVAAPHGVVHMHTVSTGCNCVPH